MLVSKVRRAVLALAALATCASAPGLAAATTQTAQFQVITGVQTTCLISATTLSFGQILLVHSTGTGSITVNCTVSTPFNIGLDAGVGAGATISARKMTGPGGATLTYSLFQDPAHSLNWGQTVGVDTVAGSGNGQDEAFTVYGNLPAGQSVPAGAYVDTVTATLTF